MIGDEAPTANPGRFGPRDESPFLGDHVS